MSFVAACRLSGGPSALYHEMTAVVGEDGELYWLCRDVATALGYLKALGESMTRRRVRHVTGRARFSFPAHLADMKILSHPETTKLFLTATDATVRRLGEMLDSPRTRLLTDVSYDVTRVMDPVRVRLFTPETTEPDEVATHFFVWYHFFKEAALDRLYTRPRDSGTYRAVVEFAIPPQPDAQQLSNDRPFPDQIVFTHGEESVTYLPVARSPIPADSTTGDAESAATEIAIDDDSATDSDESDSDEF